MFSNIFVPFLESPMTYIALQTLGLAHLFATTSSWPSNNQVQLAQQNIGGQLITASLTTSTTRVFNTSPNNTCSLILSTHTLLCFFLVLLVSSHLIFLAHTSMFLLN
jgi:hypothetical protein